ncbi:MAG: EAL domain-containing protein [Sphingomonadales bacterium]
MDASAEIRVAVVDNDRASVNFAKRVLKSLGAKVVVACHSGADALQELREVELDIVLCPAVLSDMGGGEFLRHLSDLGRPPDVLFMAEGDRKLLATVRQLAEAHGFKILGTLDRPLKKEEISHVLAIFKPRQRGNTKPVPQFTTLSAKEVRDGIAQSFIFPHFQPKVEISTGEVIGVECLARWRDPNRGTLGPGAFIPVAEEEGLMRALTRSIFQQAMAVAGVWQVEDISLKISVNVTPDNLEEEDFPAFIIKAAEDEGIQPGKVILEVTESRIMGDIRRPLEALATLRLKGVGLSIDDFGTGYSNLQQLQRIPASEIKVDRAFVYEAWKDEDKRAILKSSIELGHSLGMSVTAEGAETIEDWRLLEELGCDVVQGFFVAKPMPGKDFQEWLKNWKAPRPVTKQSVSELISRKLDTSKISKEYIKGWRHHKWVAATATLAVILMIGVGVYRPWEDFGSGHATHEASVAVLPFISMSSDPEQQFFADGLTEEILNVLARNPALKVPGRTTSFYYKNKNLDLRELGKKLGVAHVLEGSVRKSGDRVRITAQLVETSDGFHMWSDTFEDNMEDMFGIQDEIAAAVAEALEVAILKTGHDSALLLANAAEYAKAHQLYLGATPRIRQSGLENLKRARALLEEAVITAPNHAEARAELSNTYLLLAQEYQALPIEEAFTLASYQVAEAVSHAPRSAVVLTAMGRLESALGEPVAAEDYFKRAIRMDPKYTEAYIHYGILEQQQKGDLDAARALFERAIAVDPLAPTPNFRRSVVDEYQGKFEAARTGLERVVSLYPDFIAARDELARIDGHTGNLVGAIRKFEEILKTTGSLNQVSRVLYSSAFAALGEKDEAAKLWKDPKAAAFVVHRNLAFSSIFEGDLGTALSEIRAHQGADLDWRWKGLETELLLAAKANGQILEIYQTLKPLILTGSDTVDGPDNVLLAELAYALAKSGDLEGSRMLADMILDKSRTPVSQAEIPGMQVVDALAYALKGDDEAAVAALEAAYGKGFRNLLSYGTQEYPRAIPLDQHPVFERLWTHPAFQDLMAAIRENINDQKAALAGPAAG